MNEWKLETDFINKKQIIFIQRHLLIDMKLLIREVMTVWTLDKRNWLYLTVS